MPGGVQYGQHTIAPVHKCPHTAFPPLASHIQPHASAKRGSCGQAHCHLCKCGRGCPHTCVRSWVCTWACTRGSINSVGARSAGSQGDGRRGNGLPSDSRQHPLGCRERRVLGHTPGKPRAGFYNSPAVRQSCESCEGHQCTDSMGHRQKAPRCPLHKRARQSLSVQAHRLCKGGGEPIPGAIWLMQSECARLCKHQDLCMCKSSRARGSERAKRVTQPLWRQARAGGWVGVGTQRWEPSRKRGNMQMPTCYTHASVHVPLPPHMCTWSQAQLHTQECTGSDTPARATSHTAM